MISAFGVEHGDRIGKGLGRILSGARKVKPAVKSEPLVRFKPIEPKGPLTGPGSMRGRMDPSAHATRTASHTREH